VLLLQEQYDYIDKILVPSRPILCKLHEIWSVDYWENHSICYHKNVTF